MTNGYLIALGICAFFGLGCCVSGWHVAAGWFGCGFFVLFMGGLAMAEGE